MNWKTMESAPKDGTEILIRYPLQGNVKHLAAFNTIHMHWTRKGVTFFPASQGCEWTELPPDDDALHSAAALDVLAERKRQIKGKGWSTAGDDEYTRGELRAAAACYVNGDTKSGWPWYKEWWKPTNDRRDLVKAAALILAEIERLDRADLVATAQSEVMP